MNKPKVIIEVSGGNVIALHADSDTEFHIVNWDSKTNEQETWERQCKTAYEADRLVDKKFDYYINEILNA